MKTKEIIVDVLLAFAGVKIGERLGTGLFKKFFQKKLEKNGPLFMNKATDEMVVVVEVVSGGLFKSPSVIYETGGKKFQISLDSFTESFRHCTYVK